MPVNKLLSKDYRIYLGSRRETIYCVLSARRHKGRLRVCAWACAEGLPIPLPIAARLLQPAAPAPPPGACSGGGGGGPRAAARRRRRRRRRRGGGAQRASAGVNCSIVTILIRLLTT